MSIELNYDDGDVDHNSNKINYINRNITNNSNNNSNNDVSHMNVQRCQVPAHMYYVHAPILTYFNHCDHFSLTDNMFTALKSC